VSAAAKGIETYQEIPPTRFFGAMARMAATWVPIGIRKKP